MKCFNDFWFIHFVNFNPAANLLQESNRQFTAEMFAKFVQAIQDLQASGAGNVQQFTSEQVEAQKFEKFQNPFSGFGIQQISLA